MKLWGLKCKVALILAGFLLVIPAPIYANSDFLSQIDPFELYPQNIKFMVRRNNERVGTHRVLFHKLEMNRVRVTAELDIKVSFLKIPLYEFNYNSNAIWHKNNLISLLATQNEDGIKTTVKVSLKKDKLIIEGPEKTFSSDLNTFPSNHWNAKIVSRDKLINTLNGELSRVTIKKIGKEIISAQGRAILALKFVYSGDVDALVWYTDKGHWVKLQFAGKDGSRIDYECVECGLETKLDEKGGI